MRKFQIAAPDGRRLMRDASDSIAADSLAAMKATLVPGYTVEGEVLSGLVVPPLPDGLQHYTLMTHLLRESRDELLEWLKNEGYLPRS